MPWGWKQARPRAWDCQASWYLEGELLPAVGCVGDFLSRNFEVGCFAHSVMWRCVFIICEAPRGERPSVNAVIHQEITGPVL